MGKFSVSSDPRGLIFEAYRIDGITLEDCRSIFFDWALGLTPDLVAIDEVTKLYNIYVLKNPNHPMSLVLKEGVSKFNFKLRANRKRRVKRSSKS